MSSVELQTYIVLGILFAGLSFYAHRRKDPMWLWPGTHVKAESIRNIFQYNRSISMVWAVYSCPYWLAALLSSRRPDLAAGMVTWAATFGVLLLIIAFAVIWLVFRQPKDASK